MTDLPGIVNNQINRSTYRGASLVFLKGSQWSEHYIGTADGVTLVKSGLIYDPVSVSRVIGVGTAIISLLHRGKLELNVSSMRYCPGLHKSPVTLRQLLAYSSGINPLIPNHDNLNATELKEAINHTTAESKKEFFHTDINFLLLGSMLGKIYGKSPDVIFKNGVFQPFGMTNTGFNSVKSAVLTVASTGDGLVHDSKAKVLGVHSSSAGLFSNLRNLGKFCQHYLTDDFVGGIW